MPRNSEFTRKQRAEMFLRSQGFCEACGAKLKTGEAEFDHVLPLELGGESALDNGQTLCHLCHAKKTAKDVYYMRKAERIRDKQSGAWKPKSKSQWGMGGRFRKKMNGEVVRVK